MGGGGDGGKGDDAVRFKYVFKGWGGMVQNNLKIGVAWYLLRIPLRIAMSSSA